MMGSTSRQTKIEWINNSGTNEFVLYAPNSDIHLENNATFIGMIAGKTVHLNNNAIVKQDDGFELPPELNPWYDRCGSDTEGAKANRVAPSSSRPSTTSSAAAPPSRPLTPAADAPAAATARSVAQARGRSCRAR